jgi:hypothetical protein
LASDAGSKEEFQGLREMASLQKTPEGARSFECEFSKKLEAYLDARIREMR